MQVLSKVSTGAPTNTGNDRKTKGRQLWWFYIRIYIIATDMYNLCSTAWVSRGPGWLNELDSWITWQLIQAYHQYDVGSRPALYITKRVHSTRSHKW